MENNNESVCVSAEQLLKKAKDDGTIRVVKCDVPYTDGILLNDLAIAGHGTEEDRTYAFSEWYRSNIRRGNTIVQVFDSSPKEERTFFGRRGFEKFFDLMYQYIQYGLGELKGFDEISFKNASEHEELYGVIFNGAKKALENNNKIVIYKLVKANGENAQVSWVKKLKAWIIASKNVSILVRNPKDVDLYTTDRFNFAKLIAKEWFRHVHRVDSLGLLDELKEYMNGKTFVGEYCGNQDFQHLVKYTEVDIHFVAVVDNNSDVSCISPGEAFSVFQKYGLTCVKHEDMGTFETWEALNLGLKRIYEDVAKADIESGEEGSVLYMTKKDQDGKEVVLSLSKLKTLEYRIYRKLREKLKHVVSQKRESRPWREMYKKFVNEVEELSLENKPPMPLSYYSAVARTAFEFAENYKNKSAIINDQYITFLSILLNSMSQKQKLTPELFSEANIAKVMTIPWTEYYQKYDEKDFVDKPMPEVEVETQKADAPSVAKKVYVIVPIGMPGMGKSFSIETFRKVVESNKCNFSVVSSDATRKEVMEKLAKSNKKLSSTQLFDKSGKEARDLYNERVGELIFTSDKRKAPAHFIFLDKNHPPNALKGTFELIKNNSPHLDLEIIALTPLITKDFFSFEDQGRKSSYPFSKNFFFTCLDRVQSRKEHETLPGKGADSAKVLAMFFQMMRGVKLDTESVVKNGFHKHLQVPFTNEKHPAEIPTEVTNYLIDILKSTKPGDTCNNEKLLAKFSTAFEQSNIQFQNPDPAFVESCITEFFQSKIRPSINPNAPQPQSNTANSEVEESKIESQPQDKEWKEASSTKKNVEATTRKVYVIVPTGMPGMGKSFSIETFRKVAESYQCDFSVVSSDATRKEAMDEMAKTNSKLSRNELFDKTGKRAKKMYDDKVAELISTSNKRKCLAHFVFLDKNHPPNALKGTFELIRSNSANLDVQIIALTPLIKKDFFNYEDQGRKSYYPFSKNFFFTCLSRVQGRKEHETLPGNGADSAKVLAMFFQMMRGVRLDTTSVLNNGFDKHVQIPFTNEDQPAEIPPELADCLVALLKVTRAGGVEDLDVLNKFYETFEKSNIQFKNPDPAYVEECVQNFFKDDILPSIGLGESK